MLLGAIADDFTGATDLANMLVRNGMRTVQVIGVPNDDFGLDGAEAVVVALKSRTAPVASAVADSKAALAWLTRGGARQVLFKYCSTFDSTAQGNIGQVADMLADELGADIAVVCPAFPGAGRTIYQGHLFVGSVLLSDSPMKDHPLTPMRDSSLPRLMGAQTERGVGLVPLATVDEGADAVAAALGRLASDGCRYAVVDVVADDDLHTIGTALAGARLITGGSGIAAGLPENFRRAGLLGAPAIPVLPRGGGRPLVIAGSCSRATRAQIAHARDSWPVFKVDPYRLADRPREPVEDEIVAAVAGAPGDAPVVVYASDDPDEVAAVQEKLGRKEAGEMIEGALARIATRLVGAGTRRLIVAGGETSGAVVSALGVPALRIGPEIDPGVPWTETLGTPRMALALKSGNFGSEDFFDKAFRMLP